MSVGEASIFAKDCIEPDVLEGKDKRSDEIAINRPNPDGSRKRDGDGDRQIVSVEDGGSAGLPDRPVRFRWLDEGFFWLLETPERDPGLVPLVDSGGRFT